MNGTTTDSVRPDSPQRNVRLMAYSAAAMYGAATFITLVESFTPSGQGFPVVSGIGAIVMVSLLVTLGPRVPRWTLAPLGPIGASLIAYALSTSHGPDDGGVLYVWPVVWMSYFFGQLGAVTIVTWVSGAHWLAVVARHGSFTYVDRWIDVTVVMAVVAGVVVALGKRDRRLVADLEAEARVDLLTGLLNRRGFNERVPLELAFSARRATSVAIASFDVDHFKSVNDEWGHDVGDKVLARFGRVLAEQARTTDLVARIGGEEFVALLPDTDLAAAHEFAERVRHALANTAEPGIPRVTASAGVAAAAAPEDVEVLLRNADFALYAAKSNGRDRTVVHSESGAMLVPTQDRVHPPAA